MADNLNFLSFDSSGYAAAGQQHQQQQGVGGPGMGMQGQNLHAAGGGGVAAGNGGMSAPGGFGFSGMPTAGGFGGGGGTASGGGGGGGMMMGGGSGGIGQPSGSGMGLSGGFFPSGKMSAHGGGGSGMMMSEPGSSNYIFDDEPPLLEELGIDVGSILRKSTAMLRPHGLRAEALVDGDLIGPVLFCLLLATAHLLAGKVLFGYVLGWSLISSFVMSTVIGMLVPATDAGTGANGVAGVASYGNPAMNGAGMNTMAGQMGAVGGGGNGKAVVSAKVEFGMTASLLGYSMLPMVGGTVIASVVPRGVLSTAIVFLCVIWSSTTCSSLLTIVTPSLKSVYYLVLYPCILFYSVYALLALY